jgi:hypothetical protein
MLERDGDLLQHAGERLQKDAKAVKIAAKGNPWMLKYAHRSSLLSVVSENGKLLLSAPRELLMDRRLCLAAVRQEGNVYSCLPMEIREEPAIAMAAVTSRGGLLPCIPEKLRKHPDYLLAAIRQDPTVYAKADLANVISVLDIEAAAVAHQLASMAVRGSGSMLEHVWPLQLKGDRGIVLSAVSQEGSALRFASVELRQDYEVVKAAFECDPYSLEHAEKEVVLKLLGEDGARLEYAGRHRTDPEVVGTAIRSSEDAARFVPESLSGHLRQFQRQSRLVAAP